MKRTQLEYTKGYYTVLTSFFFVLIILVVVFGLMNYGRLVTLLKAEGKDRLNQDIVVRDAKEKLFYCHGRELDQLEKDCDIAGISGYRVVQEAYGGCEGKIVKESGEVSGERTVYIVPVTENRTCIGRLEIYP